MIIFFYHLIVLCRRDGKILKLCIQIMLENTPSIPTYRYVRMIDQTVTILWIQSSQFLISEAWLKIVITLLTEYELLKIAVSDFQSTIYMILFFLLISLYISSKYLICETGIVSNKLKQICGTNHSLSSEYYILQAEWKKIFTYSDICLNS